MIRKLVLMASLMPLAALAGTLGDGLDNTSLVWTTGGTPSVSGENVNWSYITDDSYSDGDCVTSGAGGAGDATSWLRTTVTGPCKISFRYKYQSYGGTFSLTCDSTYLINKTEYTSSGEGWNSAEFDLASGSHTLTFTYHHPGVGFANKFNGVRIDEFAATGQSPVVPPTGGTTWYVNGSTGSDYNSGTSESSAKATIQAAIDASSAGDTILVAPGTYAPIDSSGKAISIRSTGGAGATIIDGGHSQRCATLLTEGCAENERWVTEVTGFTFQHGYENYGSDSHAGTKGGTLKDCIFRYNESHGYGNSCGVGLAKAYNCLFYGNTSSYSGIWGGGVAGWSEIYNCTIVDNDAYGVWDCTEYNTIVWGNTGDVYISSGHSELAPQYSCFSSASYVGAGCVTSAPQFVDAANGDYRLAAGSPCIDAGNNSYVTGDKDLAGNARVANGTVDIGCYEYGATPVGGSLTDGLVAYYPFDGNANDASGNGFDFINNGAIFARDRLGNVNSACHFDGTAYLNRDHDGMPVASNSFTFACWVKPEGMLETSTETVNGMGMLFDVHPLVVNPAGAWGGAAAGMGLAVGYNGIAVVEGSSGYYVPSLLYDGDFSNKWMHLAVTVDDSSAPTLYINGSYIKTGLQNGRVKAFGAYDVGGVDDNDNNWGCHRNFKGTLDDVRIYNRALSAAEVKALYDGTPVTPTPTPPATGLWTVTKYNLTEDPFNGKSLSEIDSCAIEAIGNRFMWNGEPVTETYDKIAFAYGLAYYRDVKFPSDMVDFPGGGSNYFVVDATTSIYVPRAGEWTFACGCDDVFSATISGPGVFREFHSSASGEMSTDWMTVNFPSAGIYNIRLLHVNGWGEAGLEFSVAEGSYSYFDSSAFKLVGDPASGVTLAGSGEYHTVTFDLNGADGVAPAQRQVVEGAVIGTLPTPTREGYEFLGWHRGKDASSEEVTASTVVTGDLIVYAVWRVAKYTVWFDANGGAVGTSSVTRDYGTAIGALPTPSRAGHTFLGWFTAATGGTQVYASTTVSSGATYYAHWQANGGGTTPHVVTTYTVSFDGNGGSVDTPRVTRVAGEAVGSMPTPEAEGFKFLGWFTAKVGGTLVTASTKVTANVTYYAHWQAVEDPNTLWDEDEAFAANAAATFDGFLTKDGEVQGTIQMKAGKANARTGVAKVTAKVLLLGQSKKLSYKGVFGKPGAADFTPGTATLKCNGQPDLELRIGRNALWGEMGAYEVEGSRNVFAKADDALGTAALKAWQGTYTLVLETVDAEGAGNAFAWGYSGLTLTVGAKGKVKVTGTMVDGAKVNVASQLLVGEKRCCIPVVIQLYSKKGGFGFNLWLQDDGEIEVGELGEWDATASKTPFRAWFGENVPVARTGGALPSSLSFLFMGEPEIAGAEVLYDFVPWEVVITTGTRWGLPVAGNVKLDRESEEYVDAKNSSNAAGLKLTYVAKTGAFKGSFKLYTVDGSGRLKKITAKVSGVMVGRQGYGTATVRGVGSWPVAIQ